MAASWSADLTSESWRRSLFSSVFELFGILKAAVRHDQRRLAWGARPGTRRRRAAGSGMGLVAGSTPAWGWRRISLISF